MTKNYHPQTNSTKTLIDNIRRMIDDTRTATAVTVNTGLTLLH
jgi:hypothetical protein